jgi:4-amino-4-deoxy-L-arabinose transferase-like glycosyltransferase
MKTKFSPKLHLYSKHYAAIILLLLAFLLSIYYIWGIRMIPFHPDESTYIFMSSDFDALLRDPMSLAWNPENQADLRQIYRERDAPFARYLIGMSRSILGLKALPVDWDWGKSWQQNRLAGALPDEKLLTSARLAITLLLPLSLLFVYLSGVAISGRLTGLLAALLLGTNSLILLHDRRAMSEGALTFGIAFALWGFLQADKRPWLAGIGMALAVSSKHSALTLLPVGLLAVCWRPTEMLHKTGQEKPPQESRIHISRNTILVLTTSTIQYLGVFLLITWSLNPFLWRSPIQALTASWENRQNLLQQQLNDTVRLAPEQALFSPTKRAAVLLANLYLVAPSFAEVGNYLPFTAAAEENYLNIPGHNLLRNLPGAGVLFILTIFGSLVAIIQMKSQTPSRRRALILALLASLSQIAAIIVFIPLPWQRYVIPLVPFSCLWSAYAIGHWFDPPNAKKRDNFEIASLKETE